MAWLTRGGSQVTVQAPSSNTPNFSGPVPICIGAHGEEGHGLPCGLKPVTKNTGNLGRLFWCCYCMPDSKKFFQHWADQPLKPGTPTAPPGTQPTPSVGSGGGAQAATPQGRPWQQQQGTPAGTSPAHGPPPTPMSPPNRFQQSQDAGPSGYAPRLGGPASGNFASPPPQQVRVMPAGLTQNAAYPATPVRLPAARGQGSYATPPSNQPAAGFQQGYGVPGGGASSQGAGGAYVTPSSQQQQAPRSNGGPRAAGSGNAVSVRVQMQPFSEGRFAAKMQPYDVTVKEALKASTPSRVFEPQHKVWTFPLEEYHTVVQALQQLPGFDITIDHLPQQLLQQQQNSPQQHLPQQQQQQQALMGPHSSQQGYRLQFPGQFLHDPAEVEHRLSTIPPELASRLYRFQLEGVRFGLEHGGRVLLGDEMGLGKTVQAVCLAACYPEDWPLLVVCPSSVRLAWLHALREWLPPALAPAPHDMIVISTARDIETRLDSRQLPQRHAVIVSYDLVQKMEGRACRYPFVICDESHMLKSRDTHRTRFLGPLVAAAKRAVLLSGTPALSRPAELFTQVDMLRPGYLGSYEEFGARYCNNERNQFGRQPGDFIGYSNLPELHARLEAALLIRRLKADVLRDLPSKIRRVVSIEPDRDFVPELERIKGDMLAADSDPRMTKRERNVILNSLRIASGPAKVKGMWEHVQRLLAHSDKKLLLFAHHETVMAALQQRLQASPYGFVRIDGKTPTDARQRAVDRFQTTSPAVCRVALLSIQAAGVGITLTEAEVVVFAELAWTPAELVQAEDRAHRIGQPADVAVHYLLAPGTIDDIMWRTVHRKLGVIGTMLDGSAAGSAMGLNITSSGHLADTWVPAEDEQQAAAALPSADGAGPSSQPLQLGSGGAGTPRNSLHSGAGPLLGAQSAGRAGITSPAGVFDDGLDDAALVASMEQRLSQQQHTSSTPASQHRPPQRPHRTPAGNSPILATPVTGVFDDDLDDAALDALYDDPRLSQQQSQQQSQQESTGGPSSQPQTQPQQQQGPGPSQLRQQEFTARGPTSQQQRQSQQQWGSGPGQRRSRDDSLGLGDSAEAASGSQNDPSKRRRIAGPEQAESSFVPAFDPHMLTPEDHHNPRGTSTGRGRTSGPGDDRLADGDSQGGPSVARRLNWGSSPAPAASAPEDPGSGSSAGGLLDASGRHRFPPSRCPSVPDDEGALRAVADDSDDDVVEVPRNVEVIVID